VALVLLAGAGGWWLRAPAVPGRVARPTVADADVDITPPAARARRDAAVALAKMPDDPWSLAESLAGSSSAAPDTGAKENCGIADAPQFAQTDSTEQDSTLTRGAGPRYLAAQARIDAALRASGDPLDRVTADFVNSGDLRTEAGADAAVTQQAAVSNDPRVVSLGHAVCERAPSLPGCAALTAERWAQVDTGNGIPWIELLGQAQTRGDAAGVRDAMTHLTAATRFDMRFFDVPGAVVRQIPEDEQDLAAGSDLALRATGRAAALVMPAFKPLLDACRNEADGDPERARQCVAISDTMYAHSDTLISYTLSGVVLQQTTGDASRRASIKSERTLLTAQSPPDRGLSQCGVVRDLLHELGRKAALGEVEAMREASGNLAAP